MDQGIIRRKLSGAALLPVATAGAERAWPLALARVARTRLDLAVDCGQVRAERLSLTELLDLPPERGLIALLEGPRGGTGVLMLAPEVLAALIEAQTMGRVRNHPLPPRRPTRTDAALVADLIDAALAALEEALQTEEDLVWTDGFRYASFLEEPRPLALLLEDAPYKVLRCDCDLGGQRQGTAILALPAEGHGRRPHRAIPATPPDESAAEALFTAKLAAEVLSSQVELMAVLGSLRLPLSAALSLRPGEILPLGAAAIEAVLMIGQDGRPIASGKLGQQRGVRAVRLADLAQKPLPPVTQPNQPNEPARNVAAIEPAAPQQRRAAG